MTENKIKILIIAGIPGAGKTIFRDYLKQNKLPKNISSLLPENVSQWERVNGWDKINEPPVYNDNNRLSAEILNILNPNQTELYMEYDCLAPILNPEINPIWEITKNTNIQKIFQDDSRLQFLDEKKDIKVYAVVVQPEPEEIIRQFGQRYKTKYMPTESMVRKIYKKYIKGQIAKIKIIARHNRAIRKVRIYQKPEIITLIQNEWIKFLKQKNIDTIVITPIKSHADGLDNKTEAYQWKIKK